ncbi:MAG: chromosome segregation protein SMC [Ignavibacteriaceae bacterium]|nr:chromosome segregation protein SMC [Ignavibacteriaceae bacterium]
MYLSKLDILGFKSFQQKTDVRFNQGITAIVGPNGCGKTNIVDAIRWCLGEQKTSTLRADSMENVIFNGTATKKPMGMAEVSLTIQNDKGVLPTEYNEVVISRRIFRSGESEYLLNKNICRLKDITNLFMDTGMGANAYSVIELKMVESILSNKADERRVMFEEAAGVNKYKQRRRLTLKKLDEVKSDLTRVNDIYSEVEKKTASLERQAKRADRHNKISSELREKELNLSERELAAFSTESGIIKSEIQALQGERISIDSMLREIEDSIAEIKKELNLVESQLTSKREEITQQTEKIHKSQERISVSSEKKNSLDSNIKRFETELGELQEQKRLSEERIVNLNNRLTELTTGLERLTAEKEEFTGKITALKAELEQKKELLASISSATFEKYKEINSQENEIRAVINRINTIKTSVERINSRVHSLDETISKSTGFINELNQEKDDSEKKLADAELLLQEKQKEKDSYEQQLNNLRERELDARGALNNIHEKIAFLQNLIDNLEGFSKGAKALVDNKDWAKGEINLLANLGNTSDEYKFAIESALRSNINNLVVETIDDVLKAVKQLRERELGKASFYIADTIEKQKEKSLFGRIREYLHNRAMKKVRNEKGFIAFASELVSTEEKWGSVFTGVLKNYVVADNLENALAIHSKYPAFHITTLNGDYLSREGVIEGGSAPKADETIFGRKQLLESLKKEIPEYEGLINRLRSDTEEIEAKYSAIDLKSLSEKIKILILDLASVEKQIGQFEFEKKRSTEERVKHLAEIEELQAQLNALETEKTEKETVLTAYLADKDLLEKQKTEADQSFKAADTAYNKGIYDQNNLNLDFERQTGERKNVAGGIRRNQENIELIAKSSRKREQDIKNSRDELVTVEAVITEEQERLNLLTEERDDLRKAEKEIEEKYAAIRGRINELENSYSSKRKERELIGDSLHKKDLRINEISIKTENLRAHIRENYNLEIESKHFEDAETFDIQALSLEVQTLKQQIKNLGPVNLLAYSEFEEEKQRLEFLTKQRDDLLNSEKDLVAAIEEINTNAKALFMETFQKIRENFINIFRTLFNPGDEADLKLEEDVDPLESKIEIIAKPKGKRPTNIEMLSGGEKTLTAIALLFSIYLVKPSPFCILDEIDAPLDDANVDRFTRILKDFSNNTQFIVVTHNKRTMESADILYGVTMQEEGVSKLVGVKFDQDFDFVN